MSTSVVNPRTQDFDKAEATAVRKDSGPPPPQEPFLHRRLLPQDMEELRALHEDWFPVRYSQSFYDCGEW